MRLSPCVRHADRAGTSLDEVYKQVYLVGCSQRHMSFIVLSYAPWHCANHSLSWSQERLCLSINHSRSAVMWSSAVAVKARIQHMNRTEYWPEFVDPVTLRWLGSRVVSVLGSGAEGPGFKSQSRRCRVTVSCKMFTPIVPLFTKQRNW